MTDELERRDVIRSGALLAGAAAAAALTERTALFSRDPTILAMAASYLCVVGLAYPFIAPNTLISAFQ